MKEYNRAKLSEPGYVVYSMRQTKATVGICFGTAALVFWRKLIPELLAGCSYE